MISELKKFFLCVAIKNKKTTIEKKRDLQNKICQSDDPSNDFTINPPKLNAQAPKKTINGPQRLWP